MPTIHNVIPYKIIFLLVHCGNTTYTVYYDNKTSFTSRKPPKLIGNDTDSVWENIIIQMRGIALDEGKTLDEADSRRHRARYFTAADRAA